MTQWFIKREIKNSMLLATIITLVISVLLILSTTIFSIVNEYLSNVEGLNLALFFLTFATGLIIFIVGTFGGIIIMHNSLKKDYKIHSQLYNNIKNFGTYFAFKTIYVVILIYIVLSISYFIIVTFILPFNIIYLGEYINDIGLVFFALSIEYFLYTTYVTSLIFIILISVWINKLSYKIYAILYFISCFIAWFIMINIPFINCYIYIVFGITFLITISYISGVIIEKKMEIK